MWLTKTFFMLNVDTEVPGADDCGTDHTEPGGLLIVAFRQGDVHREPCHHY